SRLTVIVCCNANGTKKLRPWVIRKAKTPRALQRVNVSAMGAEWRWNKKAWMNQFIMKEWLTEFYTYIGSERCVVLLMDNFSAHEASVEQHPPPQNIHIVWLPANSTSR